MKFILPETGGTGRGILYIAGVFLLGISMILLGNKNSSFMNAYIRKGDFLYEFGWAGFKKDQIFTCYVENAIWILEKETNKVLKSYESIYKHPISYGFKEKNISEETVQFYSGILNEIFLCLWYKDIKIVIGAFRINNVTRADFSHVYNNMDDENKKNLSETECWEYYEALPVYPLGDIRDYLILLGFLFDMDLEDIYSEGLHEQVAKNKLELEKSHLKKRYMTLSV